MLLAGLVTSVMPKISFQGMGAPSGGIEFVYSISTLFIALLVGVALTLAIGLAPAYLASRVDVIRALHPQMRTYKRAGQGRILAPIIGVGLILAGLFMVQAGFSGASFWIPNAFALVGWAAALAGAFFGFCVAMPNSQFDVEVVAPPLHALKHVTVQSPQWRYVQYFYARGFGHLHKHA
jgi:hypothetical protein